MAHDWIQLTISEPCRELLPGLLHQIALPRQVSQPQSLHHGTFRVESTQIKLGLLAGCGSVLDHLTEIAQAPDALRSVLSAKHLKHCINSVALRQVSNRLFVVALFVVDGVL